MCDELNRLMERLEQWRVHQALRVSTSAQIAAFHLTALTEEKSRVYGMNGFLLRQSSLAAHVQMRDDIFALEWALRGLTLPDPELMLIERLRDSWRESVAETAVDVLKNIASYCVVRDLVICAKRGGYLVHTPSDSEFHFTDPPSWTGTNDVKSRLIAERISLDRNPLSGSVSPADFSLDDTSMREDFPQDIQCTSYSGSDFWALWKHIHGLCVDRILEDCRIRNYGTFAATSETKELGILVTKRKLIDEVVRATGVEKATVSTFLDWLTFNFQTPRKFSLFHCPLVEVNEKFVLIAPHTVLMAHSPTIFLRQLAHHDKAVYDACSSEMEKRSLRHLKAHIEGDDRVVHTGVKLRTTDGEMELDVVEYDKSRSILSIGEAKFSVRPDSASEVDHENDVLAEGVEQLKRNRGVLLGKGDALESLLVRVGAASDQAVEVMYFLLPTRFTGSDFLDIPTWTMVLPIEFCLRPQCKGQALRSIWADYRKLWESSDEEVRSARSEEEFEIAGFKIIYPAFKV